MVVAPQEPYTEQQYWKWGSTTLAYNFFTVAIGRMFIAYFRKPMAPETLEDIVLICSFQSRLLPT